MPTRIVVDQELCKGCLICIEYCPRHVLTKSAKPNTKGTYNPVPKNITQCNTCRRCELYCPDFAITVIAKDGE